MSDASDPLEREGSPHRQCSKSGMEAEEGKDLVICHECGTYLYRDDMFCAFCGTLVGEQAVLTRHPIAFYCTSCGAEIDMQGHADRQRREMADRSGENTDGAETVERG